MSPFPIPCPEVIVSMVIPDAMVGGVNFLYVRIILQDGVTVICISQWRVFPERITLGISVRPREIKRHSQNLQ